MQQLSVQLGTRSYPILVGSGLLSTLALHLKPYLNQQVFVITNEVVAPLYLEKIKAALSNDHQLDIFIMADGEEAKSLQTWQAALDALLSSGFSRDCTVLALGGGVVGDLAGFVAASFHRGVDFIQIPTTLLAQVDSSVGGKTAVNHPRGKNLIGAFHQPRAVLIDTNCLQTLPQRELSAGLAEVIKYGVMADHDFFSWLENTMPALVGLDEGKLEQAIVRSCAIKAQIVAADEKEQGQRALLNLGHTFGHAIEKAQGFGSWLHGEAVAAGIAIAADIACQRNMLSESDYQRTLKLLKAADLPVNAPVEMPWQQWQDLMLRDKKVKQGKVRFVLPENLGHAVLTAELDPELIRQAVSRQRDADSGKIHAH
ncbi:3-dehydroquinate synthase [Aliidiomarina soli]|uniref:3-dehydroquinate synthase n=1 Tax=Aliidiomarina soli TaxID=1928574 RepID=A0A432WEY8_9GAMM|nr:3-dehydroquinate synthase [Aliidiomarina soli]RUO32362.1 3-dehydroquinate synthase [Aliidiomarina soli]